MSTLTTRWKFWRAQNTDPVVTILTTGMQALADQSDATLGESGQVSATVAANTTQSFTIALSRSYAGNNGATMPGTVIVNLPALLSGSTGFSWWIDNWTGSGTTVTGFRLNVQFSGAQTARLINWRFLPHIS